MKKFVTPDEWAAEVIKTWKAPPTTEHRDLVSYADRVSILYIQYKTKYEVDGAEHRALVRQYLNKHAEEPFP